MSGSEGVQGPTATGRVSLVCQRKNSLLCNELREKTEFTEDDSKYNTRQWTFDPQRSYILLAMNTYLSVSCILKVLVLFSAIHYEDFFFISWIICSRALWWSLSTEGFFFLYLSIYLFVILFYAPTVNGSSSLSISGSTFMVALVNCICMNHIRRKSTSYNCLLGF